MKTIKTMILPIDELPKVFHDSVTHFLTTSGTVSLIGGKNSIKCPKEAKCSVKEQLKNSDTIIPSYVQDAMLWVENNYDINDIDSVIIDNIKTKDFYQQRAEEIEIDNEK